MTPTCAIALTILQLVEAQGQIVVKDAAIEFNYITMKQVPNSKPRGDTLAQSSLMLQLTPGTYLSSSLSEVLKVVSGTSVNAYRKSCQNFS